MKVVLNYINYIVDFQNKKIVLRNMGHETFSLEVKHPDFPFFLMPLTPCTFFNPLWRVPLLALPYFCINKLR